MVKGYGSSTLLGHLKEISVWNSRINSAEKFDLTSIDLQEAQIIVLFKETQTALGLSMKEDGYLQLMIGELKTEPTKLTSWTMQLTDIGSQEKKILHTLFQA